MDGKRVGRLVHETAKHLRDAHPQLLDHFSVDEFMDNIRRLPEMGPYNWFGEESDANCMQIETRFGEPALEGYLKLVLLSFIQRNGEAYSKFRCLPDQVLAYYDINHNRIVDSIERNEYSGRFLFTNSRFQKDLAIVSGRLTPVGAEKLHLARMPKRFMATRGLRQFLSVSVFVGLETRGFQPFYQYHADVQDPHLLSLFNEKGWIQTFRLIGEMMKWDKRIKGTFGCSWFFDPALEKVSPRLTYLRKVQTDNGARHFCLGTTPSAIRDSTLKSKTRRRLYDEGKYIPTSYIVIWPRKALIEWAQSF